MSRDPIPSAPIIAIVGQTASGKSALAMKLALKYGGEIIAADSRTIYKGMDIGTAKPSLFDQKTVVHHGLDLIQPDQPFSAAEFKQYAKQTIREIRTRRKVPFVVGGSGLYIDGLLYDFEFGNEANPTLRQRLEQMSLEELQQEAVQAGINEEEVSFKNRRHLSRAIERGGVGHGQRPLLGNTLIMGIEVYKEILQQRIEARIEQMLNQGLEKEVKELLKRYSRSDPGLLSAGYKELGQYLAGEIGYEDAKNEFIKRHKKLAKRQRTWFRRNPDIIWVQSFEQADKTASNFLRKFDTIDE